MSKISQQFLGAIFCLTLFVSPSLAQSNKSVIAAVDKAEAEKWREDLRYMAEEMPKRHQNLFHAMATVTKLRGM